VKTILLFVDRLQKSFGASVAVSELARRIHNRGIDVRVFATTCGPEYEWLEPQLIIPTVKALASAIEKFDNPLVVVHSSPFMELIAETGIPYIVWEHGNVDPAFVIGDCSERERQLAFKKEHVYPRARDVICVSEFSRYDIGLSSARVIVNGCDHVPNCKTKSLDEVGLTKRPLRVGTMARLGVGESAYKGFEEFCKLVEGARAAGVDLEASVFGAGTEKDASVFREANISVLLNQDDDAKWNWLRSLDVYVSCSLLESFNLPVVEAQASGVPALALDTGGHPETTPLIFGSLTDMLLFLRSLAVQREHVFELGRSAYHFVRGRFLWERTVDQFLELAGIRESGFEAARPRIPVKSPPSTAAVLFHKTVYSYKRYGLKVTAEKVSTFVRRRMNRLTEKR
jgi:glycosyltransferase involved in cell wall biosynthesis